MINTLSVLEVISDAYENKLKFDIVSTIDNTITNFNKLFIKYFKHHIEVPLQLYS